MKKKKRNGKKKRKIQEKQIVIVLIAMVFLILLLFSAYFAVERLSRFEYLGLEFKKIKKRKPELIFHKIPHKRLVWKNCRIQTFLL